MAPLSDRNNNANNNSIWPRGPVSVDSMPEAVDYFVKYVTKERGHIVRYVDDLRGLKVAAVVDYPEPTPFGFDHTTRFYVLFKRNWENQYGRIYDKAELVGQNISPDILEAAYLDNFAVIACVMIDHTMWTCKASDWLRYDNENGTARDVEWPGHDPYKEVSIPRSLMKRIV